MTSKNVANRSSVVTMMSHHEIAKLTGKQTAHVVRDIEAMLNALNLHYPEMDDYDSKEFSVRRKVYNGRVVIDEIKIDHDLTMTLMTGYSVPLRHKVAKRWRQLEAGEEKPIKSTSHLPEYRRARAIKMEVEAMSIALSFMPRLSDIAKQTAMARAVNDAAGMELLPLPKVEEHLHTAGDIAEMLGVSPQKIGRLANKYDLKTEQYGMFVWDKAKHSEKQVEAFRYNQAGIEALRHLINDSKAA
ncbi:transcriptional regulator [Enterobacter asburiae]|uniref:Transcriptional regulator n=1 Tax=Enterobacter asburiae TaxID=61645 RepID=A0AAW7ZU96_ENTAS|nr:transcriptional regulator [Enterobacter asburiae]MDO7923983.1 transcriptional regulator [Enterobacter asburiae]MDV0916040.1 transcriptional regulator [Enterobacter asburiae]MDV0935973.1 transcriptional regulator [Enterobacter asburiae]MDV0946832.1 transcriptional regulator [Enterobacter asburiae]MDV0992935.1 transcriptional regulator [Enterobacter asburiae]